MAIQLREKLAASWYTPKSEEGEAAPSRFRVKPLDGAQYMEVLGEVEFRDGNPIITAKGLRIAALQGVVGWENVPGADGEAEFSPSRLRQLPANVLLELGQEVIVRTELGADAEKNS